MEIINRKKYIHIECETCSIEIFTMLDKTESETPSDIENLLEGFDREYIARKPTPDNKGEIHQLLTTEETVYVEGEVLDK